MRKRSGSDATEVPAGDTPTESFGGGVIEFQGLKFSTVKLFHGYKGELGWDLFVVLMVLMGWVVFLVGRISWDDVYR